MWMGWTTAPVAGSGPCPTCKARVANPQLFPSPLAGEAGFPSPLAGEAGFPSPLAGEAGFPSPLAGEGGGDAAGWGDTLSPSAVRHELEQVRAGDHRDRLPIVEHEHRLLAPKERLESIVERGIDRDLAHRRVHRGRHGGG